MFTQKITNRLFTNQPADSETGIWCLVLPRERQEDTFTLEQAIQQLKGSLILLPKTVTLNPSTSRQLVPGVSQILSAKQEERGILWARGMDQLQADQVAFLGLDSAGAQTTTGFQNPTDQMQLVVARNRTAVNVVNENTLSFGTSGSAIYDLFNSPGGADSSGIDVVTLPLTGAQQGRLHFDIALSNIALGTTYNMGFQMHFQKSEDQISTEKLPLAATNGDMVQFNGVVDLLDVDNSLADPFADATTTSYSTAYDSRGTFLSFAGTNQNGSATSLNSFFSTIFGQGLQLWPVGGDARLIPTKSSDGALYFAPEGKFTLGMANAIADRDYTLMGGLHGAEFFCFRPRIEGGFEGDKLQFIARQPAYAPVFPFPEASPLNPPIDPTKPMLTKHLMTSWAALVPGAADSELQYIAQPRGAALYGVDKIVNPAAPQTLGHMIPGYSVNESDTVSYPVLPYVGMTVPPVGDGFTEDEVQDFEFGVVAPVRRDLIGPALAPGKKEKLEQSAVIPSNDKVMVTNPNGVLIEVAVSGGTTSWQEILIGQTESDDPSDPNKLSFVEPGDDLQEAFQNGSLFLVATNPDKLGGLVSAGTTSGSRFENTIDIGGWGLSAEVGQNDYGDYTNIVLFKGRRGAIYNPDDPSKSLVANPGAWTQAADFSSPVTRENSTPDDSQLSVLSSWMVRYCADGVAKANNTDDPETQKYFKKFGKIVTDPNWQGMLILRMTTGFPDDLIGLKAGITDLDAFYAHHFGVAVSQIKQVDNDSDGTSDTIAMDGPSAMFGLIYYEDPEYVEPLEGETVQPVPPELTGDYDFRLLTLKVLFENSAIKYFESFAQLTLENIFDMPVQRMGENGNVFNTLVLRGSYQDNNGQPVYSLGTDTDYHFFFDTNIFNKIELTSAKLLTRTASGSGGENVCWFALSGYLDFQRLTEPTQGTPFDILSFGVEADDDLETPRKGLRFHNLGIEMRFTSADDKTFVFKSNEIRFDIARSTPREHSLFTDFALDLNRLVTGRSDDDPAKQGYLNVSTDLPLLGVTNKSWYGLRYRVNLGTPGELAGKINLDAYMVIAWSPDSKGDSAQNIMVGLELPGTGGGAKLLDIQNVLKLSIGQIQLSFIPTENGFLLMLTEIALKFLGILKIPPGGSTNFFLFGNAKAGGDASALGWFAMYKKQEA